MASSRPVVAATEITGLMRGQPFLVLQRRALKDLSLDRIVTPANQTRPKRCDRMTTSSKARRRSSLNLLGILSASTTSRRIHGFGSLGADTTILTISRRIEKSGSLYF